jgi:hypothetical protein
MNTNLIDEFIKTYNKNIESYNIEYGNDFKLISKKNNLGLENHSNILEYLFYYYSFSSSNICSFLYFFKNILESNTNKDWLAFAEYSDYGYYYVLDRNTNEVFTVFSEDNTQEWYCAKDLDSFFVLMNKYIEIEIFLRTVNKPQGEDYFNRIYEECLIIAGGLKYSDFIKHLVGN